MSGNKGDYEVLEVLGRGSFGTVSKIRSLKDGKVYVWKEINFGGMGEREKAQLVAEVNILRELRNPFIVRYVDRIVEKSRTRLYIIMEYCSGGDLRNLIKKHRSQNTSIDETFIWKVFAQIVLALKDCHRRTEQGECKPVLHRDLKPANVLLDMLDNVKIADFGLAKELSSLHNLAQTNVGTPYYMAPEIVNDQKYGEKSDIWALGCLLHELAALRPPFEASNAVALAVKITAGKVNRIPPKYSDALADAVRSMLQVDVKKRPRVEDLEFLPGIQSAMKTARLLYQEHKAQQVCSHRVREIAVREEQLKRREEELKVWEQRLIELEENLQQREQQIVIQEQWSSDRWPKTESATKDRVNYSQKDRAAPISNQAPQKQLASSRKTVLEPIRVMNRSSVPSSHFQIYIPPDVPRSEDVQNVAKDIPLPLRPDGKKPSTKLPTTRGSRLLNLMQLRKQADCGNDPDIVNAKAPWSNSRQVIQAEAETTDVFRAAITGAESAKENIAPELVGPNHCPKLTSTGSFRGSHLISDERVATGSQRSQKLTDAMINELVAVSKLDVVEGENITTA